MIELVKSGMIKLMEKILVQGYTPNQLNQNLQEWAQVKLFQAFWVIPT